MGLVPGFVRVILEGVDSLVLGPAAFAPPTFTLGPAEGDVGVDDGAKGEVEELDGVNRTWSMIYLSSARTRRRGGKRMRRGTYVHDTIL